MTGKRIRMYTVNRLKELDGKIFEYEDDDEVNRRGVRACERAQAHWLEKDGIMDESLRSEVLSAIEFYDSDCCSALARMGWEVSKGR